MKDSRELNKANTDIDNTTTAKPENCDPAFDPAKFSGAMTNPFCPFFPDMASLFGKANNE